MFPISGFLFPGVSKMFFCDSFCFQQEFRVPLEVKYHITIIPSQTVFCVHTWRTSVQISGVLFSVVHKTVFWCSVCFQNSIYVSKLDSSLLIYAIFSPGCYSLSVSNNYLPLLQATSPSCLQSTISPLPQSFPQDDLGQIPWEHPFLCF